MKYPLSERCFFDLTFWGRCDESMFNAFSHSSFTRLTGLFRFAGNPFHSKPHSMFCFETIV